MTDAPTNTPTLSARGAVARLKNPEAFRSADEWVREGYQRGTAERLAELAIEEQVEALDFADRVLALPQIGGPMEALRELGPVTAQAIVIACAQRVERTDRTRDKPVAVKAFEAATRIADAAGQFKGDGDGR